MIILTHILTYFLGWLLGMILFFPLFIWMELQTHQKYFKKETFDFRIKNFFIYGYSEDFSFWKNDLTINISKLRIIICWNKINNFGLYKRNKLQVSMTWKYKRFANFGIK